MRYIQGGKVLLSDPSGNSVKIVNQAYEHPSNPKTKLKATEVKSFRDREFLFDQKLNVAWGRSNNMSKYKLMKKSAKNIEITS